MYIYIFSTVTLYLFPQQMFLNLAPCRGLVRLGRVGCRQVHSLENVAAGKGCMNRALQSRG